MRIPFIAGNWKMFKTVHETTVYVKELRALVKDINDVTVVIAPPFTAVHAASEAARNSNVAVSAQNMYWEREGAFTGEISAAMIKEAGAEYVDHRPLRAPHALRRDRRHRQSEDDRRDCRVADAHRLHRRNARAARAQRDDGRARSADQGRPRRPERRSGGRARHGVRTRVGHRHRADGDARAGWRGARAYPVAAAAVVRRDRPQTSASCFMAAA